MLHAIVSDTALSKQAQLPFILIDLNGNNDDNSPMQSLDQADGDITITRAASQQMMHLSLSETMEETTPILGLIYDNEDHCINRAETADPSSMPSSGCSCGIWISHLGMNAHDLLMICQQHSDNALFLLLDLSNKGRMDLRAVRLDPQHHQLQPVTISMVEE